MFIVSKMKVCAMQRTVQGRATELKPPFHKDTIKVEPQDLALDRGMVLKRVIGKRYNNKVGFL